MRLSASQGTAPRSSRRRSSRRCWSPCAPSTTRCAAPTRLPNSPAASQRSSRRRSSARCARSVRTRLDARRSSASLPHFPRSSCERPSPWCGRWKQARRTGSTPSSRCERSPCGAYAEALAMACTFSYEDERRRALCALAPELEQPRQLLGLVTALSESADLQRSRSWPRPPVPSLLRAGGAELLLRVADAIREVATRWP